MVTTTQARARKLEAEFVRLGFGSGQRGDVLNRAQLLGVKPRTLRSWLDETDDRRPPPDHAFAALKMFSLMSPEARAEYLQWARERYKLDDYAPT